MKHNTFLVVIIAMATLLVCVSGCEQLDNEQAINSPGTEDIDAGQLHNQFLELMPYDGTPTSDEEVIALATDRFSELLSEQNISSDNIEDMLRQANYLVADLLNQGIMRFATDEQHPLPFDAERLAEYLVIHEIVSPRDFDTVLEFINDFQITGNSKSTMDYEAVAQRWTDNQVIPASVLSVMLNSNQFWNVDKKRPSTNDEIVLYDTGGALIGLLFGGVGSVLFGGYCSYVAAIYCTDPDCPDEQGKNLIGNPAPVRDFRNLREKMQNSIFKQGPQTAGFSAGMNLQQKCISVGVVLSLLTLAIFRKRFGNAGLAGLGSLLFFVPACLMIGTKEFSWVPLIAVIVGMVLLLRNPSRASSKQASAN